MLRSSEFSVKKNSPLKHLPTPALNLYCLSRKIVRKATTMASLAMVSVFRYIGNPAHGPLHTLVRQKGDLSNIQWELSILQMLTSVDSTCAEVHVRSSVSDLVWALSRPHLPPPHSFIPRFWWLPRHDLPCLMSYLKETPVTSDLIPI